MELVSRQTVIIMATSFMPSTMAILTLVDSIVLTTVAGAKYNVKKYRVFPRGEYTWKHVSEDGHFTIYWLDTQRASRMPEERNQQNV